MEKSKNITPRPHLGPELARLMQDKADAYYKLSNTGSMTHSMNEKTYLENYEKAAEALHVYLVELERQAVIGRATPTPKPKTKARVKRLIAEFESAVEDYAREDSDDALAQRDYAKRKLRKFMLKGCA